MTCPGDLELSRTLSVGAGPELAARKAMRQAIETRAGEGER